MPDYEYPLINFTEERASDDKTKRMKKVIIDLVKKNIYPSAEKISKGLGRNTTTLNGPECRTRRDIFKELNIKLKRSGWVDKYTAWKEEFRGYD